MTKNEADAATGAQLLEAVEAIRINEKRKKGWWQRVIYEPLMKK